MSTQSNMLVDTPPSVTFGHSKCLYEDGSSEEEPVKSDDGPNHSTMIFGQIVSGYILGHFSDPDSFRSIYNNTLIAQKCDEWIGRIQDMIDGINETGSRSLFFREYKIKRVHLAKLLSLVKILRICNLEVRFNELISQTGPCTTTPL